MTDLCMARESWPQVFYMNIFYNKLLKCVRFSKYRQML